MKAKFLSFENMTARARRDLRRAARRLPNRGPIDHATGTGFRRDQSTTKAVMNRMRELGVAE